MKKERVLVAMSGGVDSAAAAALLVEEGHEVVGTTLKLWCYGDGAASPRSCCSLRDIEDARRAASVLGIRHYVLDEEADFDREVVRPFVDAYLAGETPNPCVRCNTHLKFGNLRERARRLGFDAVATGHYAAIDRSGSRPVLRRARDRSKDQAYVLWGLTPADLAHTRFPLGERTKDEAREIVRSRGIPMADKPESQDICFVPGGGYGEFVAERAPDAESTRPGELVDLEGKVVGTHRGAIHYTIGQRRGLGIASAEPLYVVGIDAERNRVTVGSGDALGRSSMTVREVNWVSCEPPREAQDVEVKIRYRARPAPARVKPGSGGRVTVRFRDPQRAIAPGQSAVFFREDVLLGGGVIDREAGPRLA